MGNSSVWRRAGWSAVIAGAVLALTAGCASPTSAPLAASAQPASADRGVSRVVAVEGRLAERDGRTVVMLEPFRAPQGSPYPKSVEIYVAAFPTEEFDAAVTDVRSRGDGALSAEARLVRPDARLTAGTRVTGLIALPARPSPLARAE